MKRQFYLVCLCTLFTCPAAATAGEEALELVTPAGTIHGTLALPDMATPVPVALIIAGSGPTDRDGNSALIATKNDSLKMLADALAAAGFASVRYDKRGIAASRAAGPTESELRFEHYVADATAWLAQLSDDTRFSAVVVIGHSEGSLIGMLAAQRVAVPFISIAGAAADGATLLRRQLEGRLPSALAATHQTILAELEAGRTVAQVPPELSALYRPSVQPYLMSWLRYAPAMEIAKLKTPCLVVQGTTDVQVSVADAEALNAANGSCALRIIGGMNHIMKEVPEDLQRQVASYGDPTLPLAPSVTAAVTEFLAAQSPRN